jgi:methionine-rich copper-binding protein CopC
VPLVRRVSVRRAGRWVRCEVVLLESVSAKRVRVRLLHKGRQLATASRAVSDRRAVMRLEGEQRLRPGRYTLVVTAVAPDGTKTSERRRVNLR